MKAKRSQNTAPPDVTLPAWLDAAPWLDAVRTADEGRVRTALSRDLPDVNDFAALISPAARPMIEKLAGKAQRLTRRHFGRTISLYVPLYLADYCSSGCIYCGFSSDRDRPRRKLGDEELDREIAALKGMGFDEVLLLTGDRTGEAGFRFVRDAVARCAREFNLVSVETFTMKREEYAELAQAGCTSVSLYHETYDPDTYHTTHRWGPKFHYLRRLEGPSDALAAGIRTVGLGVLLGLGEPVFDALCLFRHAAHLRKKYWKSGISISFPRIRPQLGGFSPNHPVDETFLAQLIFAFRICMPDMPLVLSTRERAGFRDGMAGIGVSKMSVASRTTVGGYYDEDDPSGGQFDISDERDVDAFCRALRDRELDPVFKNWDAVYRDGAHATARG